MRVPCIVRWPGHIGAGRTSDELVSSIDLLPTLAALCGAEPPGDRAIDGVDISAVLLDAQARSPRADFWYYRMNDLEAIRAGRWKLHVAKAGAPVTELYDVVADRAESVDRAAERPDEVARLEAVADAARGSLGDARLGIEGADRRPIGRVADPRPLTTYEPTHPYYQAEYDLPDRG
jgi:arylsulfatase A-like enzyme